MATTTLALKMIGHLPRSGHASCRVTQHEHDVISRLHVWSFGCGFKFLYHIFFYNHILTEFHVAVAFDLSSTPLNTKFCPPPHLLERIYYSWRVS
jgi:hypothetical protein